MNYSHSAPVLPYALRWYSIHFNHSNDFVLAWPACISNVRLHTYVHVGLSLSLSLCVSLFSPPPPPPLCSGPWIKSFISFALLSLLLLSPSLSLFPHFLCLSTPPPSLPLIHRLQMPKENEWRDRSSFCFVFICLFVCLCPPFVFSLWPFRVIALTCVGI